MGRGRGIHYRLNRELSVCKPPLRSQHHRHLGRVLVQLTSGTDQLTRTPLNSAISQSLSYLDVTSCDTYLRETLKGGMTYSVPWSGRLLPTVLVSAAFRHTVNQKAAAVVGTWTDRSLPPSPDALIYEVPVLLKWPPAGCILQQQAISCSTPAHFLASLYLLAPPHPLAPSHILAPPRPLAPPHLLAPPHPLASAPKGGNYRQATPHLHGLFCIYYLVRRNNGLFTNLTIFL